MWVIRGSALFIFMVAAIAFVALNSNLDQRVAIDLYWRKYETARLLVALFVAFLVGAGFSPIFVAGGYFRKMAQYNAARKTIRGLQSELTTLRNRPIEDSRDVFGTPQSNVERRS